MQQGGRLHRRGQFYGADVRRRDRINLDMTAVRTGLLKQAAGWTAAQCCAVTETSQQLLCVRSNHAAVVSSWASI